MADSLGNRVIQAAHDNMERKLAATVAFLQSVSGTAESDMKEQASWTDRTGNARNTLSARVAIQRLPGGVVHILLKLAHGMEYGIWLELRWGGRYAIVGPTAERYRPIIAAGIARIWG